MIWLLWFLVGFALVTLTVRESIFDWPRRFLFNVLGEKLGGWLACGPCAAFWVGVAVGVPDLGILAQWLPTWAISSAFAVAVTNHLLGGLLLLGAVRLVQTFSHSTLAIIAAEEQERRMKEAMLEEDMSRAQAVVGPVQVMTEAMNQLAGQVQLVAAEAEEDDDPDGGVGHA